MFKNKEVLIFIGMMLAAILAMATLIRNIFVSRYEFVRADWMEVLRCDKFEGHCETIKVR